MTTSKKKWNIGEKMPVVKRAQVKTAGGKAMR